MLLAIPLTVTGVELTTSINDVTHRGPSQLAGAISLKIKGNACSTASALNPIFVSITLDHGATLAETLVDQSSADSTIKKPIYLAMECSTSAGMRMLAAPTTASIVRWVKDESSFWLRFASSSDSWLSDGSHAVPLTATDPVSITIGISARTSDTTTPDPSLSGTNLPFNTRNTSAIEGQYSAATSTLICGDLSGSTLDTTGVNSLLGFGIIAYDSNADVGGGLYSGMAGTLLGINFTDDFTIGRGKRRQCSIDPLDVSDVQQATSGGLINASGTLQFLLNCGVGGDLVDTNLVNGAVLKLTNRNSYYGFDASGLSSQNSLGPFFVQPDPTTAFVSSGTTLYKLVDLVYTGPELSAQSLEFEIEGVVKFAPLDDSGDPLLDWFVRLKSHEKAEDTGNYAGFDQHVRCAPNFFPVEGDFLWEMGVASHSYVPRGSDWRYLDDGSELTDPSWRTTGFFDATWLEGPGELGFGDGDEATFVRCRRGQATGEQFCPPGDPAGKIITTYFREEFFVTSEIEQCLALDLLADDGAIAYLNGNEIGRYNISGGTQYPWSLASAEITDFNENRWWRFAFDPALLVSGQNTLAVEVHQGFQDSDDLSFNAGLSTTCGLFWDDFEAGDTSAWTAVSP